MANNKWKHIWEKSLASSTLLTVIHNRTPETNHNWDSQNLLCFHRPNCWSQLAKADQTHRHQVTSLGSFALWERKVGITYIYPLLWQGFEILRSEKGDRHNVSGFSISMWQDVPRLPAGGKYNFDAGPIRQVISVCIHLWGLPITKYHKLGVLNNRNFLSLEAGCSRSRYQQG